MPRRLTIYLDDDISPEDYVRMANGLWCALRSMHPADEETFSMSLDRASAVALANELWRGQYADAGLWGEDDYEESPEDVADDTRRSACDGDRGILGS